MFEETQVAIKATKEAGKILSESFFKPQENHTSIKNGNELVSKADYASNDIIIKAISTNFPNHKIISEESNGSESMVLGNEPTWIIDPLDGTKNFVSNIPLFGVSITLMKNKEPIMAIIFDPLHNDLCVAEKGGGTTLNGKPVTVSDRGPGENGMLLAGRGHSQKAKERYGQIICALEKKMPYFRRFGSASIMLISVACGRADATILTGNKLWDTAAGALLVKEAGGTITDYCGNPWTSTSNDLVASNGKIHNKIVTITKTINGVGC